MNYKKGFLTLLMGGMLMSSVSVVSAMEDDWSAGTSAEESTFMRVLASLNKLNAINTQFAVMKKRFPTLPADLNAQLRAFNAAEAHDKPKEYIKLSYKVLQPLRLMANISADSTAILNDVVQLTKSLGMSPQVLQSSQVLVKYAQDTQQMIKAMQDALTQVITVLNAEAAAKKAAMTRAQEDDTQSAPGGPQAPVLQEIPPMQLAF